MMQEAHEEAKATLMAAKAKIEMDKKQKLEGSRGN